MIRLILTGGLGNQMFEYAAAKSLAHKLNKELTIDLCALKKRTQGTKRNFELGAFNIEPNISSSWKTRFIVRAFPFVEKHREYFKKKFGYFRDNSAIVYLPEFEQLEGDIILHGHFQNEKYFEENKIQIKNDFTFKEPLTGKNLETSNKIKLSNSVSIHVRRGDYLTDTHAKNIFETCSKDYYEKAIARIEERVNTPRFFIFSDDFDWVKKNIRFENSSAEFIDWNKGKDSYIDMQLMSLCKHNIIANSSFSWWAAWLNNNSNKIVISTNQWFKEIKRNKDLVNFYPKNWRII